MRYKILYILLTFLYSVSTAQQSYVHQVIFLNEGWFDFVNNELVIPPSLGSYDPATGDYDVFAEIPEADFASDVLVDDVIYVAADEWLITFDKHTYTRLQTKHIPGIRKLALWNDQLLVSRGDYLLFFDSYFQVFDRHTLELLYELDTENGPQYASEGIVVHDDIAYLAINNAFVWGEEVGYIGMIDLQNRSYAGELSLGPAGINPDNIMLAENRIYTLNNKDFSSASISAIDILTHDVITHDLVAANSGCGTSTLAKDLIYYMEYGVDKLARFDVHTSEVVDTLTNTHAYYGLIDDKINGRLIATWTDFFSQGIAYILTYEGDVLSSFDVGVSPGNIALDIRMVTGVNDAQWPESAVRVFPNPASDMLFLSAEEMISDVQVTDILGQLVYRDLPGSASAQLSIRSFPAGVYAIRVGLQQGGHRVYRVVRE